LDPSDIAQEMLDTGRRARDGILAGGAWGAWGLDSAHAVTLPVTVPVILTALLLLTFCGYCILKGRSLGKKRPSPRRPLHRGFLMVTIFEAAGASV
jgi:hypothetical protein